MNPWGIGESSNTVRLTRTTATPMCLSLLLRTHCGLPITPTEGAPCVLVIAVYKHVDEACRTNVRSVVADVRANLERRIGSGQTCRHGALPRRDGEKRGSHAVISRGAKAEDDRLAPELDMAVKKKHKEKKAW